MDLDIGKDVREIMCASQLAAALEASATPKPGNVHRCLDFESTRYEHFLAGSISIGPFIMNAALNGLSAEEGKIGFDEIGVGKILEEAIRNQFSWHKGGNTHFGILMLFIPLSASAGANLHNNRNNKIKLQQVLGKILESTTISDTYSFYSAISLLKPKWFGVLDKSNYSKLNREIDSDKLFNKEVTYFELMKVSKDWDGIARELSTCMNIAFNVGYPTLINTFNETKDINISTVNTYLTILSKNPDTFIARKIGLKRTQNIVEAVKIGMKKSIEISHRAKEIIEVYGGLKTRNGLNEVKKLDKELSKSGNPMNPGTTADITAASLFIALLHGFRF